MFSCRGVFGGQHSDIDVLFGVWLDPNGLESTIKPSFVVNSSESLSDVVELGKVVLRPNSPSESIMASLRFSYFLCDCENP